MFNNCPDRVTNNSSVRLGRISVFAGALILAGAATAPADIPDANSGRFGGLYKITASSDPIFPANRSSEYFLDFGQGFRADRTGGRVAVSIRRNPNVSVRIMAWQYLPDQRKILIGTPSDDGSRRAVARGAWNMRGIANGVIFQRGNYQVILQRADPSDY